MQRILQLSAVLATALFTVSAQAEVPVFKFVRTILVNESAAEAKLADDPNDPSDGPTPLRPISENGADTVTTLNFAGKGWFELPSQPGVPVNVTGFRVPTAEYEVYFNDASIDMDQVTPGHQPVVRHGKYNPVGDGARPDLLVRNASGTQTSVDDTPVRTTTVSEGSAFLILDQVLTIGTGNRPKLQNVGDKYGFVRRLTVIFFYDGVEHTYEVPPGQTYTEVKVWNSSASFDPNNPSTVPVSGKFQVSDDLMQWFTVPFHELDYPDPNPVTWPKTFEEFVLWYPLDQNFHGKLNSTKRRFYRIVD